MINLSFNKDNIKINLKAKICENTFLKKYLDFEYFTNLCKTGCPNYKTSWACPPNSPKFDDFAKGYKYSIIFIGYSTLKDDNDLSQVHTNLKNILTPMLVKVEDKLDGVLTSFGGSCSRCKTCAYINNEPCYFPNLMRYSMEAMGINLDLMSKEMFNHSISWDSNSKDKYCTVIGSVLCNSINDANLDSIINDCI